MNKTKILTFLADVAIIAGVGLLWHHIGYKNGYNKAVESLKPETEYITHFDTIRVSTPVYSAHFFSTPMLIPFKETEVVTKDSVKYVSLPTETKVYADSSFYAEVSGINPSLDYIEVYQKTNIVNRTFTKIETVYPKRDYVSLRVDGLYDKTFALPMTLNVGYRLKGLDISAGAGYDPIQKSPVLRAGAELKIGFGK